jgi:hypothetical protein
MPADTPTDATPTPDITAEMQEMAERSKPSAEHGALDAFEGEWRARVEMWWEADGDPMVSTGTMINRWVLGKRYLEQIYEDDQGMFSGRGAWGYNRVDRRYEGSWMDTASTMMQFETGTRDDAGVWTMRSSCSNPMGSGAMDKRTTIEITGPNEHVMTSYIRPNGAPEEFKCMVLTFTRR